MYIYSLHSLYIYINIYIVYTTYICIYILYSYVYTHTYQDFFYDQIFFFCDQISDFFLRPDFGCFFYDYTSVFFATRFLLFFYDHISDFFYNQISVFFFTTLQIPVSSTAFSKFGKLWIL